MDLDSSFEVSRRDAEGAEKPVENSGFLDEQAGFTNRKEGDDPSPNGREPVGAKSVRDETLPSQFGQ